MIAAEGEVERSSHRRCSCSFKDKAIHPSITESLAKTLEDFCKVEAEQIDVEGEITIHGFFAVEGNDSDDENY